MKNVTPFVKKLKEIDTVEYWLLLRFQMDCISAELNASSHAGFVKRISVNHPELKCFDLTVHMVFNMLWDRGYFFTKPEYRKPKKVKNGLDIKK